MKPYSLVTPAFDHTSGGIKVMYALYGWLLTKGQIVHLNSSYDNVDFVAIYPEIIHGNPAKAKTVVRYLLNKPGVMSSGGIPGPTSFAPDEITYVFSKMFSPNTPDDRIMFLPAIDIHLFKDQKRKRHLTAVFEGKGENLHIHPKDSVLIDRSLAQDQQELADLLNECQVLYSYDPVSAMTEVARLCGCRVVMLNKTYSEDDYKLYEPGVNGMSFDVNKGEKLDVEAFRDRYLNLRKVFEEKLDQFIELTQK